MSRKTHKTVMTVAEDKTKRSVAQAVIQLLRNKKRNLLGAVSDDRTFATPEFSYERI